MMSDAAPAPTAEKPAVTSLELTFDAGLEDAVRRDWDALMGAGLSSMGAHTAPSNRPHITLLARRTLQTFDAGPLAGLLPADVTLGAPVLFGTGDRRVLARSIVPTGALLGLHAAVHAAAGPGDDLPHTAPGEWTPHVTLARRLRLADLGTALALVGGDLQGQASGLRRWDSAERRVTPLA